MSDTPGREPDAVGAARGAVLIVVIGAAIGIAYNAVGLASRPRHGLAWIKTTTKLESLEGLQSAPGAGGAGDAVAAAPGPAAAGSVMGPPTPAVPEPPKPASDAAGGPRPEGSSRGNPAGNAEKPPGAAAAAATPNAPPPKAPAPARKPAGAPAPPVAEKPAVAETATPPSASGAAQTAARPPAADLPVIPDVTGPLKVEIATLKRLHDANAALVLDAREAAEYSDGHIRGAVSLTYNDALAEPERVKNLDPAGRPIVVYCSGGDCELSRDLARVLVEAGKRKVLIYEGGYPEWQAAGYPVARGPNP